jgi:plastocyanin
VKRIALLLVVLALSGCGGDEGGEAATEPTGAGKTIEVSGTDFRLDPDMIRLDAAGTYTFRFRNEGKSEHALEIEGGDVEEETETIGPGETAELTVELAEGDYEVYCPVDGHREMGMEGDLIVGGGGATTDEGQTGTVETETGSGY